MKLTKLNPTGFAQHLALVVVVLAVAIGGTAVLIKSHADPRSSAYSCDVSATPSPSTGASWSPKVTVYNNTSTAKQFTMSDNVTAGAQGSSITSKITVKATSHVSYSWGPVSVGKKGSTMTAGVNSTNVGSYNFSCSKSFKVS